MGTTKALTPGTLMILELSLANVDGFVMVIIQFEWLKLSMHMVLAMSWQPFTHGKMLMNLPRY
ncbi:hypothetical protein Cenrod_0068 [Candidatus Symbiobacter mobilis CR]|uniref:Uncharacterized protein n=1 Tax=Candidatus Symbiobacter mobilis CR TaxID=946483 RepID=U5N7D4_9BURK|nr:hypothetical protein Cenrod_0068 [Candidatus Symbiobacter mobilis CR]